MNDKGEIKNYYYSADWSKVNRNTKLKKFPVFGSGAQNEIYIIKRYVTGFLLLFTSRLQYCICNT